MGVNITYEKSALATFLDDLPKLMLQYKMFEAGQQHEREMYNIRSAASNKRDEVGRLAAELNKAETERNYYVGEVTKTQNAINAITDETTSIQDIYKTGSVPDITATITGEPIKYYNQKISEANAQMGILKPYFGKAVSDLGKINRALDFLQKGVGVGPGIDKAYGPEDFVPEVYAPKRKLEEVEQAVFDRYGTVSQSLLDQLSAAQYAAEKSRLDIAGGYRERKQKLEISQLETQAEDLETYKESIGRYNEYADEVRDASMYFFEINSTQAAHDTELDANDKEDLAKELDVMYLREGAGFFPEDAFLLGISYHSADEDLEDVNDKIEELVSSGQQLSPEQSQQVEIWKELRGRGVQLRNENIPKYSDANVKRGVVAVQPYLERDRMLAEAYYGYKKMEGQDKEDYRIYIKHVLGVDFHNRATVRNRLKRYFMEDLINEYTGGIPYKDLSKSDKVFFMARAKEIEDTLGFDLSKGEFIDE